MKICVLVKETCNKPNDIVANTPLQYSHLENPMDGEAWWAKVHGVTKSQTWQSKFTFTFHFPALEKEMATHFSVLSWRIPGMGEPGGLLSMGSRRVGHDWCDLAAAAECLLYVRHCSRCFICVNSLNHPINQPNHPNNLFLKMKRWKHRKVK